MQGMQQEMWSRVHAGPPGQWAPGPGQASGPSVHLSCQTDDPRGLAGERAGRLGSERRELKDSTIFRNHLQFLLQCWCLEAQRQLPVPSGHISRVASHYQEDQETAIALGDEELGQREWSNLMR